MDSGVFFFFFFLSFSCLTCLIRREDFGRSFHALHAYLTRRALEFRGWEKGREGVEESVVFRIFLLFSCFSLEMSFLDL